MDIERSSGSKFNKIVLFVAIVLLIVILFGVGYAMKKAKNFTKYPPILADCPDYWEIVEERDDGSPHRCKNTRDMGNGKCKYLNTDLAKFKGPNGIIEKCKWAKHCGVVWDGITNKKIC